MTPSKIFLYLLVAFIAGIGLGTFSKLGMSLAFFIWIFAAVALILASKFRILILAAAIIFSFGLGVWRHGQSQFSVPSETLEVAGQKIEFQGTVAGYPDRRKDKTLIVVSGGEIEGKVLITVPRPEEYEYGDQLLISGTIKKPEKFDGFDYASYLAKDGIFWTSFEPQVTLEGSSGGNFFKKTLFGLRQKWEEEIFELFPEPQNSFLAGLILGARGQMSDEITDSLNRTGTTHIVALSGFNVTIIAVAIFALLQFLGLGRRVNFFLAAGAIASFAILTGASPSVVRASVMGILGLLAWQAGRLYWPRNALVFAAAVMLFSNPQVLRFDLSFSLSFLATLGLIYLGPILREKYFKKWPESLGIRDSASATIAAQAFVLPLLILEFGRVSLISPLANILILPAVPWSMLFGFLATLVHAFFEPAGLLLGILAHIFLSYILKVIDVLAKVPLASVEVSYFQVGVVVLYLAGISWFFKKHFYQIRHADSH